VKAKSRAVTGVPSLHLASERMRYVSLYGGRVVKLADDMSPGRHVRSPPEIEGRLEHEAPHGNELYAPRGGRALRQQEVEAAGLRCWLREDNRAATLRRLRTRAAGARDDEQQERERRG
jgi:hypothetical protein